MWNHNIHYHGTVMGSIPRNCRRALEVGCGDGLLALKLAHHCREVIAIDSDSGAIARARTTIGANPRVALVHSDVMMQSFPDAHFDLITAVASLHHLPLERALTRFRNLLEPSGTLVVIGLHRPRTIVDYAVSATAFPVSWLFERLYGHASVAAPVRDPTETRRDIKRVADAVLPGAVIRRHLFFRHSMIWRKAAMPTPTP